MKDLPAYCNEDACENDRLCYADKTVQQCWTFLSVFEKRIIHKPGIFFARFFGKCKQVFVRNFELDDFLDELDKFSKELDKFSNELVHF